VLLTRRMLTPVRSLIAGAEEVGRGNLEVSLPATTHDELGQLTTAFSAMVEELRQKVALKNTFSSYMDPAWSIVCWAPTARSWKPAKSAR
jgi:adenylate cyclase